jgi:hypothetical protein
MKPLKTEAVQSVGPMLAGKGLGLAKVAIFTTNVDAE